MSGADPITAGLNLANGLVERIWPDPVKQSEEKLKLAELAQNGDIEALTAATKVMIAQLEVNKAEAESGNWFIAGWRPAVGWIGAFALGYQFILHPLLMWLWSIFSIFVDIPQGVTPPPVFEAEVLFTLISGMLGIGGMRSYDKLKGTHTPKIGK